MAFLAPLFLVALAALAVPVILHLAHRERREPVYFPSLTFVRRVPFRTTERRRIRDWLLLLLRAAAVALLVLAFSRPFIARGEPGAAGLGTARELVVLLDRSVSMTYGDRWQRGLEAARNAIRGVGPEDRATVVLFAEVAEVAGPGSGDPTALEATLARARPNGSATRFAPALQLAADLLEQSTLPGRVVVLITDFQRAGWDERSEIRLPPGTVLEPVDLSDADPQNLTVTGVALSRTPEEGGRVTVTARVANLGTRDAEVRVQLGTRDQALHDTRIRVGAGDAAVAQFTAIALPPVPTPAWVRLAPDRLAADDEYRFVLRPIPTISVLLVHADQATERELVYLRRALGVGRDPLVSVTARSPAITAADLRERDVAILHDAPLAAEPARQLARFVEQGGGLLWALGPRTREVPAPLGQTLGAAARDPVERTGDRGGTFGVADYGHPLFAPFRGTRGGDYSGVRVFRHRPLAISDSARVLAWMDDGSALLAETRAGSGRALLWGSDLGNVWNDFPLRAVFVPTLHQAVRYLAGHREPPAAYTVGQTADLAALEVPAAADLVLESPDGERTIVHAAVLDTPVPLRTPGFYLLRGMRTGTAATPVAVNLDAAESDLTPLDRDAFLAAAAAPAGDAGRGAPAVLSAAERERRQRLWWYLALAALLLLASETAVAATRPRRAVP